MLQGVAARRFGVVSLVLAVMAIALVMGSAAPVVVAQGTGDTPTPTPAVTISLTPSEGPSGTQSRIRVVSRDDNQPVTLLIGVGAAIGSSTGGTGGLGADVLETDFTFFGQPGDVILVVAIIGNQLSGPDKAFASFKITQDSQGRDPLQVSVSPSQGPDSTSTTVTVSGAASGDIVQLLVNGQQSGQATAPASGSVTFTGVVMNGAPGALVPIKAIAGVGASDPNATSGGTYFRILGPGELDPSLNVSLNPMMGPSGTRATLTVSPIRAGEGVTIFLPSGVVGTGATTSGTFTNTITFSGSEGDVIPVIVVVGNAAPFRVGNTSFTIKAVKTSSRTGFGFGTSNDAQFALAGDTPQAVFDVGGQPLTNLAIDVAVGDVTGDGETNLVLAVPNAPGVPFGAGSAFVLGNPAMNGVDGQRWSQLTSRVYIGPSLAAILGFALLFDYDLDGVLDLLLSQPGSAAAVKDLGTNYTLGQLLFATAVAQMYFFPGGVLLGGGGSLADALELGARFLINYGGPMAVLDWTGDGTNDILFGGEGSVGVVVGPVEEASGAMVRLRFPGEEWFGKNIAGFGPGSPGGFLDSIPLLGISAPNPSPERDSLIILVTPSIVSGAEDSAQLSVAQEGTTFVDLSADDANVTVVDGLQYGQLGYDMAFGDLNGDGELDLVIGEPGAPSAPGVSPSDEAGAVYIVLGPLEGGNIDEIAVRTYRGSNAGDRFGGGVAVGDIDGDGIPDLHVTAIGANGGNGGYYAFIGAPPVISSVTQSGDVLTIRGTNLDANVFVDGQAAAIVTYTPTEIQVSPSGETVEVRGAFGSASSALERVVELVAGWNLVGWTGATAVGDATASITGQFSTLFTWDAVAQAFRRFDATAPAILNSLSELRNGDGVWIFVSDSAGALWTQPAASGPRSVALLAGFNLVMWTGSDGTPVADAVASIAGELNVLLRWDALGQSLLSYGPGRPDFLNSAGVLNFGDGVWLDMNGAATWEQPGP